MNISNVQTTNLKNRQFTNGEFLKSELKQSNFFEFFKQASVQTKHLSNSTQHAGASKPFSSKSPSAKESFTSSNAINTNREKFEKKSHLEQRFDEGKQTQMIRAKSSYQQVKKEYEGELRGEFVEENEPGFASEEELIQSEQAQNLQSFLQAVSAVIREIQEMQTGEHGDLSQALEALKEVQSLEANIKALSTNADPKAVQEFAESFEAFFEEMKAVVQIQTDAKHVEQNAQNKLQDLFETLNVSMVRVQELKSQLSQLNEGAALQEPEQFDMLEVREQQTLRAADETKGDFVGGQMLSGSEKAILKTQMTEGSESLDEFANAIHSVDKELGADFIRVKTATGLVKNTSLQEIYSQIKEGMSKVDLNASMQEIVIKLKPEELGKVELKLELYKDLVIAKFDVESQAVKEAIESNLKDLRSSLEQSGFTNMQFDVNVNDEGDAKQQNFHFNRNRSGAEIELNEQIQEKNGRLSLNAIVEESRFEHLA